MMTHDAYAEVFVDIGSIHPDFKFVSLLIVKEIRCFRWTSDISFEESVSLQPKLL